MITTYLLGLFITWNILVIWFYSPLRITIGQFLFDSNLYTFDQFETYVMSKNIWIGKLLSCFICFSFWTSLFIGAVFFYIFSTPCAFPLLTCLTYPGICFFLKNIIEKA